MSNKTPTRESIDDFGTSMGAYIDKAAEFSEELVTRLNDRARYGTSNYLFRYGVPDKPADVLYLAREVTQAVLTGLILDGFLDLTESGIDPDGAAVTERRERSNKALEGYSKQQSRSIEDLFQRLLDGEENVPAGMYL